MPPALVLITFYASFIRCHMSAAKPKRPDIAPASARVFDRAKWKPPNADSYSVMHGDFSGAAHRAI